MRPLVPEPLTRVRSTPSSRASLRTEGPACALLKPASLTGAAGAETCATGAAVTGFATSVFAGDAAGVAVAAGAGAVAAPFTVTTRPPAEILPPFCTCTASTTPAAVDGTS